jgi:predicted Holliday junction resolvase-like endonuclease
MLAHTLYYLFPTFFYNPKKKKTLGTGCKYFVFLTIVVFTFWLVAFTFW